MDPGRFLEINTKVLLILILQALKFSVKYKTFPQLSWISVTSHNSNTSNKK